KTMVISLGIIVVLATVLILAILNFQSEGKSEAREIDKIIEHSYETPEITTDLQDGSFVRIQFQILTDGKDARNEIMKRDFQLKNILIKELATMSEEDIKEGLSTLEEVVTDKLNEVMTQGEVTKVYTINKI